MKEQEQKMKLPKLDDLFTIQEQRDYEKAEKVEEINISSIKDFPNHPFKVINDEKMQEMVKSVKEYGVILPVIVRPKEDGTYEMISGHRRKRACELAGIKQIRCIVKDLTDDEATILMVDSNIQREEILPSEKAFAYKMKYNAIKKKVGRNWEEKGDNASDSNIKRSTEQIAVEMGVSDRTVKNYIRLTELVPYLLDLVDSKELTIKAGVQISYLEKSVQNIICDFLQREQAVIDEEQAKILRKSFEGVDQIELAEIYQALAKQSDSVPRQPKYKPVFRVSSKARKKYFPAEYDEHDIESVIQDLLESWARQHNPDFTKE